MADFEKDKIIAILWIIIFLKKIYYVQNVIITWNWQKLNKKRMVSFGDVKKLEIISMTQNKIFVKVVYLK